MAEAGNKPTQPEMVRPVLREPDALVENIYPLPETERLPDLESQDVMAEYLIERFEPEAGPQTRVVWTPTGLGMPGIERVPDGYKPVSRWRRTADWLISPKQAAAVMLGSMALFNIIGNRSTIGGSAEYVFHDAYRIIYPVHSKTVLEHHTKVIPGPIGHIEVTADTTNQVGSTAVDPIVVKNFVAQVQQAEQRGGKLLEVHLTGNASDDWAGDRSISSADSGNQQLALARAEAAIQQLQQDGLVINQSTLKVDAVEHVIPVAEKAVILQEAQADGFDSIQSAIDAADANQPVASSLAAKIKQFFTGKQDRGVSLSAEVEYPGVSKTVTTTTKVTIPGVDHKPHVPKPHWYWFVPMLPIRRRERYDTVKQAYRWQFTASKRLMRPMIISEDVEQVWLRLRPEAIQEDGTFIDEAWAFSGKYEHLFRDSRVADLLRADFKDSEGQDKSLRVMFIDQAPAKATLDMFSGLLRKFAAMDGGKLADRVSAIFVYPSESAGDWHEDPKRIGLGIDKQSEEGIAGTYTYGLKLVEMHMKSTWDEDDLKQLFEKFMGPAWVAAHEVAGHGNDVAKEPVRARKVNARGIPNAHVIVGEPRAGKAKPLAKVLRKLPKKPHHGDKIDYDIVVKAQDRNGNVVTQTPRVDQDDPLLQIAVQSTIVGRRPTQYASHAPKHANDAEHFAENAAAVTTGIEIPYEEAHTTVRQLPTDDGQKAAFATGYRPDIRGQRMFTKAVGAKEGSYPASFSNPPQVRINHIHPENDSLIRRHIARTSGLRSLYPNQKAAILARVAQLRNRES